MTKKQKSQLIENEAMWAVKELGKLCEKWSKEAKAKGDTENITGKIARAYSLDKPFLDDLK